MHQIFKNGSKILTLSIEIQDLRSGSDLCQKLPKKDLDPVLDPRSKKDLRSDPSTKKGSRSGFSDPGSKDPNGLLLWYIRIYVFCILDWSTLNMTKEEKGLIKIYRK